MVKIDKYILLVINIIHIIRAMMIASKYASLDDIYMRAMRTGKIPREPFRHKLILMGWRQQALKHMDEELTYVVLRE